ncbi:alpha/beta fold hydrolase [Vibrio methylphosphonaticus]|uniref:alpha/beta fold hydrolase n=1 Tax=Vibrio methylphosphonaticus TaxID=2946866 RepID=UPI00202A49FC|nr:alpha/beta fold hydrolase [Vibrio methylphosphonaticus]MCL9773281.1 alpha/beta fold hydrolase [Vibrio methylphosphonaticus]
MSSLLNYKREGSGQPVVLIHGLFGDLNNLGVLARDLKQDFDVISIDLRNHGKSFHSGDHSYPMMAKDVSTLLESLNITSPVIIGHSMGGKVAMALCEHCPIAKLVVLDMSPVKYHTRRHDNVLAGLDAVLSTKPTTRSEAMQQLAQHVEMEGVRQFLGKSLYKVEDYLTWRFNVQSLKANYLNILDWQPIAKTDVPVLFIKGGDSDYLTAEHQPFIQQQFSHPKAHVIAKTGHWLHAEKPTEVLRAIRKFI